MRLAVAVTVPALMLIGCRFFSTPTGKAVECSAAGAAQALAALCPPPITPLCSAIAAVAFEQACQNAANAGANQSQATDAGLMAARVQLDKLSRMGFQLSEPTDGGAP